MKDYLKLIRVIYLILIIIIQAFLYFTAILPMTAQFGLWLKLPYWVLASLVFATVLIAAGGFVINDYFDIKIDRLNRPDRVIVTNSISKKDAMRIYQILTISGVLIGLVAAVVLKSLTLGFIYVIVAGLLWFYSSSYKRMLIVGNLVVALMAALVPLIPAFAAKEQLMLSYPDLGQIINGFVVPQIYTFCGALALLGFIFVFAIELLKDIRDDYGDREMECHTIPVVWGATVARIIVTVLTVIGCGLAVYASTRIPGSASWRYALFAVVAPAAFMIWFTWTKHCKGIENAIHAGHILILLAGVYPLVYYYALTH